jgi:hypothetical protein
VRFKPAFQRHLNVLIKQLNYFFTTKNYSSCHSAERKSLTGDRFCISCANVADVSLSSQNAVIGMFSTVLLGECEAGITSEDTMWYSGESEPGEPASRLQRGLDGLISRDGSNTFF